MSGKPSLHEIEQAEKQPLWRRLGWLAMIWTGSVLALFVVASLAVFAWLIRLFMTAAGMKSH